MQASLGGTTQIFQQNATEERAENARLVSIADF
jgi:hypothetical protein